MTCLTNFPSLRRVTSSVDYIPQIDGLRAVAIASVLLFHIYGSIGHNGALPAPDSTLDLHRLSKRGVELFFTISGFVLALPFARAYKTARSAPRLRQYFLRRLTRLEPPYLLALLLACCALLLSHQSTLTELIKHFLPSVVYGHYFYFGNISTIIAPSWSLEVEVQFYLLVPILTKIFALPGRYRRFVLTLSMAVSALLTAPAIGSKIEPTLLYYLCFFLGGFIAVDDYLEDYDVCNHHKGSHFWDLCAAVAFVGIWMPWERISHILLPLVFVLFVRAGFRGKLASIVLSARPMTIVGGMCYTIYLYHVLLISSLGKLTKPIHLGHSFTLYFFIQSILMLPFIGLASCTLYLLVEKPCMNRNWPGKIWAFLNQHRHPRTMNDLPQDSFTESREETQSVA